MIVFEGATVLEFLTLGVLVVVVVMLHVCPGDMDRVTEFVGLLELRAEREEVLVGWTVAVAGGSLVTVPDIVAYADSDDCAVLDGELVVSDDSEMDCVIVGLDVRLIVDVTVVVVMALVVAVVDED